MHAPAANGLRNSFPTKTKLVRLPRPIHGLQFALATLKNTFPPPPLTANPQHPLRPQVAPAAMALPLPRTLGKIKCQWCSESHGARQLGSCRGLPYLAAVLERELKAKPELARLWETCKDDQRDKSEQRRELLSKLLECLGLQAGVPRCACPPGGAACAFSSSRARR